MHPEANDLDFMLDSYDIAVKAVSSVLSNLKAKIPNYDHEIESRANSALYKAYVGYKPGRALWKTYLWTCAVREAMRRPSAITLTGIKGVRSCGQLGDQDELAERFVDPCLAMTVPELMDQLTEPERDVVEMRADGMKYEEIGMKIGATRQAAQHRVRRAAARLKSWWED